MRKVGLNRTAAPVRWRRRRLVRSESVQITESANPEPEAIATEIADLEALIQARPARAGMSMKLSEAHRMQTGLARLRSGKVAQLPCRDRSRKSRVDGI